MSQVQQVLCLRNEAGLTPRAVWRRKDAKTSRGSWQRKERQILKKNKKANALGEELLSTLKCIRLKLHKGHTQILNKVKRKKCQPKKAVLLRPRTEFIPNGLIVYL